MEGICCPIVLVLNCIKLFLTNPRVGGFDLGYVVVKWRGIHGDMGGYEALLI